MNGQIINPFGNDDVKLKKGDKVMKCPSWKESTCF